MTSDKAYITATVIRNKDGTCREENCINVEYKVDWLRPDLGTMVCKKHWEDS